jgi:hypothetical protein
MIKTIGGFGGVRLDLTISESESYSVVFDRKRAYCSQPRIIPDGWSKKTINGKSLQKIDGYWLVFKGLFENVALGDEAKIRTLMKIIGRSGATGIAIRLWPKWNEEMAVCVAYDVRCISEWGVDDVNDKRSIAQRIKDMEFETAERVSEPPYFEEQETLRALLVDEGTCLAVNGKILTV